MTTTLSFAGKAFAVTTLPELHARAGVDNYFLLESSVAITDIDVFDSFGRAMLQQEFVSFTLSGDATVSAAVAGITVSISGVPFSKTVTIAGANNLTSASVTSFSLTGSNASTAIVNLTVSLANPSVVAIEPLGDLAVDVQYEGAYFGTLLARNVSLQPGSNALTFLGALTPDDLNAADSLISAYLGGRPVIMTAAASPDWPTSLPLYAPLLAAVSIATQLNGSTVPLINAIIVNSMTLAPQDLTDVALSLNTSVAINNILGPRSPIFVQSVDMNVTLYGGGAALGQLVVTQVVPDRTPSSMTTSSTSSSSSGPLAGLRGTAALTSCSGQEACIPVPDAKMAASLYRSRLAAPVQPLQRQLRRPRAALAAADVSGSSIVSMRLPAADEERFRLEWRPGEDAAGASALQGALQTAPHAQETLSRLSSSESSGPSVASGDGNDGAGAGDPPLPIFYVPLTVRATLSIERSAAGFGAFVLGFIANESVALGLQNLSPNALVARLHCALGNLTVSIPLNEVTTVAGMGGFPFVSVDSFSVTGVRQPGQPERASAVAASAAAIRPDALRSVAAEADGSSVADTDYGAVEIAIQVRLLNPSPATFSLGANSTLGIYVDGQRIGGAMAVNTTLYPGMNALHMNGSIAPQPSGLPAVSSLFTAYLTGVNGAVTVRGEEISLADQPTPQWLRDAVRSIRLDASVPAAANLTVLQDVALVSMSLDWSPPPTPPSAALGPSPTLMQVRSGGLRGPSGAADSASNSAAAADVAGAADPIPYLSAVVAGTVHLPFVIPVSFPSVDVTLVFTDPSSGIAMAFVELLDQRAEYTPFPSPQPGRPASFARANANADAGVGVGVGAGAAAGANAAADPVVYPAIGALTLYLDRSPLRVLAADVFAGFMETTLLSSSAPLLLTGFASPTVSLVFGNITISNVSVTQLTPAPGMGGLAHPPPRVLSVDITNTTVDTATLSVCLNVTNPSIVTASLGPASLVLQYEGVVVATAEIANLHVVPGGNILNASGLLYLPSNETDPVTYGAITTFMSRYLSRVDSSLRLLGTPTSSPYPLLQPAFSKLNTTCVFPGLAMNLLKSGTLYWDVDLFNIPTHPNGEWLRFCIHGPLAAVLPRQCVFGCLRRHKLPYLTSLASLVMQVL